MIKDKKGNLREISPPWVQSLVDDYCGWGVFLTQELCAPKRSIKLESFLKPHQFANALA
jgi:hypothetical protein